MASDWINAKAKEEEARKQEAMQRQKEQERETALIEELGPKFLEDLRNYIAQDIVAWNKNFPDRIISAPQPIPDGFVVSKDHFPSGTAHVSFNPVALRVEVSIRKSRPLDLSETYETAEFYNLEANPDGRGIHMTEKHRRTHMQPAGLSRAILEGISEL